PPPPPRPDAVRGRRSRGRRGTAREQCAPGAALARGGFQAGARAHAGWAAGAQLPEPARRPRDADPEHGDDAARGGARADDLRPAHAGSAEGLPPARGRPRAYPVTGPASPRNASEIKSVRLAKEGTSA